MTTVTVRTPCIGVCSTTSVGDAICRGCMRYAFEVIRWNGYSDLEKVAVLSRIDALTEQILQEKFMINSPDLLKDALKRFRLPVNLSLSPYCWLHVLLKKAPLQEIELVETGVVLRHGFETARLDELVLLIDEELLVLCEAHFARYFQQVNSLV